MKSRHKKLLMILTAFILLVAIVFVVAVFPGTDRPGFQEYKPTVLPPGVRVTSSELLVERYRRQFWPKFNKYLNLHLSQPNSWISEGKSDGSDFYKNWCQQYRTGSNCGGYRSGGGQNYLLSTVTNSSNELDQEVYFIKNGTSVDIILTNYPSISQQDWGKIVDGFQPSRYTHAKISHLGAEGP